MFARLPMTPSLAVLILSNLVPIVGLLFFGWSSATILLLYWSESVVIGFYTVLKVVYAKGVPDGTQFQNLNNVQNEFFRFKNQFFVF